MLNSIHSSVNFVQIKQKVISLVTKATKIDSKFLTIVDVFLGGTDHSVKVSSNFESFRAWALYENFGGYRKLMLSKKCISSSTSTLHNIQILFSGSI